jgi:hypothetical protein
MSNLRISSDILIWEILPKISDRDIFNVILSVKGISIPDKFWMLRYKSKYGYLCRQEENTKNWIETYKKGNYQYRQIMSILTKIGHHRMDLLSHKNFVFNNSKYYPIYSLGKKIYLDRAYSD